MLFLSAHRLVAVFVSAAALIVLSATLTVVTAEAFVDTDPTDSDFAFGRRKLMQVGEGDEEGDGEDGAPRQSKGPERFFHKDFYLQVERGIKLTLFNQNGTT